jgi:hypothetical protein
VPDETRATRMCARASRFIRDTRAAPRAPQRTASAYRTRAAHIPSAHRFSVPYTRAVSPQRTASAYRTRVPYPLSVPHQRTVHAPHTSPQRTASAYRTRVPYSLSAPLPLRCVLVPAGRARVGVGDGGVRGCWVLQLWWQGHVGGWYCHEVAG